MKTEVKTTIHVKIISSRGHDEFNDTIEEALARILDQTQNHNKWAYLDGTYAAPESITLDSLIGVEDVTLTNALVGG